MSVTDLSYAGQQPNSSIRQVMSAADERILTLDVLRGLAVFGIFVRNIFLFAMPTSAFVLPAAWSEGSFANFTSWWTVEIFFDGSMRAIFSMLFGASALIILAKCESEPQGFSQVERYYRRLVMLMGLGLIHAYLLLWPNDVLFFYGVFGLLLFPLRNLPTKHLFLGASMVMLFFAALQVQNSLPELELPVVAAESFSDAPVQTEDPAEAQNAQDVGEQLTALLHSSWQEEEETRRSGYLVNFRESSSLAIEQHTTELMTNHLFDIGAMLLLGMALFKCGFLSGKLSSLAYFVVLVVGYGLGISMKVAALDGWYQALLPEPYSQWDWGTINFDLSRLAIALAHLSTLILALRLRVLSRLAKLLAASGRLALTNYLTQTLFGAFVFYGFGLGWFGQFDHAQILALAVLFGVTQIIMSNIYLRYFQRGPFEYLLHIFVYTGALRLGQQADHPAGALRK